MKIPSKYKHVLYDTEQGIILANDQKIKVYGIDTISVKIHNKIQQVDVYILKNTAHPFILGSNYMKDCGVVLDFQNMHVGFTQSKICLPKKTVLEPNSETLV